MLMDIRWVLGAPIHFNKVKLIYTMWTYAPAESKEGFASTKTSELARYHSSPRAKLPCTAHTCLRQHSLQMHQMVCGGGDPMA